jgi:hypothetical protein
MADGEKSDAESAVLEQLIQVLGFSREEADEILSSSEDGALQLSPRSLKTDG